MTRPHSITRDVQFLFEIGSLRHVVRTWQQFGLDVANVGEHTLRVIWIALTLAKYEESVNHEKLIKMALMHDMAESRTGDVHYLSRQYVDRNEVKALEDMTAETVHQEEVLALVKEYEERQSLEAKLIKDADILDVEFEMRELESKGFTVAGMWRKSRDELIFPKLFSESAKLLWQEMALVNPHAWHVDSPGNRYQSGDWKTK